MAYKIFSYKEFEFDGIQDQWSCTDKICERVEVAANDQGNLTNRHGDSEDSGGEFIISIDSKQQQKEQQQQPTFYEYNNNNVVSTDASFDLLYPPVQACIKKTAKPCAAVQCAGAESKNELRRDQFYLSSLRLLKSCGNGFKRLSNKRILEDVDDVQKRNQVVSSEEERLSTVEIMRIAGERFIRSSLQARNVVSMLNNPFDLSFAGLANEDLSKVELVELLLASAEKVSDKEYEHASKLLNKCHGLCSKMGNPVQRVAYYFSEALRDRIDRATSKLVARDLERKNSYDTSKQFTDSSAEGFAYYLKIPFTQVDHFAGIQAIVEDVSTAKKIHVIDFAIRKGVQWTVLMQALASRVDYPVELLKVTAVGSHYQCLIEETGERLKAFAQSISLPFTFNVIVVSDMLDLKENHFSVDAEEAKVIYCEVFLRSLIPLPDRLDSVMKVIKNLKPCLMVVSDVETNHNSPNFINRFIESLFYFGAYFDCLDAFMEPDDCHRIVTESLHFGEAIRNIIATEGEERQIRNAKIEVWRTCFECYGLEEIELSSSCLYTAKLVLKKFGCKGDFCTLEVVGKSLVKGWKGVPLHSLFTWKFINNEE